MIIDLLKVYKVILYCIYFSSLFYIQRTLWVIYIKKNLFQLHILVVSLVTFFKY